MKQTIAPLTASHSIVSPFSPSMLKLFEVILAPSSLQDTSLTTAREVDTSEADIEITVITIEITVITIMGVVLSQYRRSTESVQT